MSRLGEMIDAAMMSEWSDRLSGILLAAIFVVGMGMLVILLGLFAWGFCTANQECARWERKIVHQEAYISYQPVGKAMIPVNHPARDVDMNVCVELKNGGVLK